MELWDAYNANGTLAGFELIRGDKIPANYYHLVCEAVIRHRDGEYLLMQRSFEKDISPGKWEIGAGGSALKGEDKKQAVLREIREETGIDKGDVAELYHIVDARHQAIFEGFLLVTSCDKERIRLQKGETIDYKWVSKEELLEFYESPLCTHSSKERLKEFIDTIR
jgi:8-oxo-dGTP pyrophosphatase MutT (NUDIX family)